VDMHPVLNKAFASCLAELEVIDTSTAQLHPEGLPHVPSVQQSVEQVICSIRSSRELLERRLKRGRVPRAIKRTKLEWMIQLMILSFNYVPANMPLTEHYERSKQETATAFHGRDLAKQLAAELAALDELLDRCRAEFGMERIEHHPLLGPMRVDQWRRCQVLQLRLLTRSVGALHRSLMTPITHTAAHRTASAA
jgi:hypothetical protein